MDGLAGLAARAQIARVGGRVHPYGWLLAPEGACQALSTFMQSLPRP